MNMYRTGENTWTAGTYTIKRVAGATSGKVTWYVIDAEGGMAGFDTRKAALHCCEVRTANGEEK